MTLPAVPKKDLEKARGFFKKLKEDIMKNARAKLKQREVKKMAKKDVDETTNLDDIPDIEDREVVDSEDSLETPEKREPIAELKEESNVQLVTNEQLIQYKLDNLGLDLQNLNSKLQDLIEVLRKKK